MNDGDLVLACEGSTPRPVRTFGHWLAATGLDLGDVDAVGQRPGAMPGSYSYVAFSLLSNVSPFLDGDVLGMSSGGGVEVLVPEDVLAASMGMAGTSIDIDAVAWDASGRLHFSIQTDLDGTTLGTVQNGDILRIEFDGTAKRVLTEMDIEEKYLLATGVAASIGDVHGLELVDGEAFVTIQSPSDADGGVLDCGQSPSFVMTDAGAGLGGAELDALMLVTGDSELPGVRVEPQAIAAGGTPHFTFTGDPGGALLVLWSGSEGFVPFSSPGFGAWYLDPADPWLNSIFTAPTLPVVPLDGSGRYEIDYPIPFGVEGLGLDGAPGWTFQVMDLANLEVSEPFRVSMP